MLICCSVEAECYCHSQKCGNGADTQSVENQVEQDEEPAEDICCVSIFSCSCMSAVLNYCCWFGFIYLPFNIDFITFSFTSHHSTKVSWRIGFCMYVYVKRFKRALISMH